MRVVRATGSGGPEVLEPGEADDPQAGPAEVVVDVAVAEVLFLDTQLRAGWGREFFRVDPPFVPGAGVAGVVASAGGGATARVGRRVVADLSGAGVERARPGPGDVVLLTAAAGSVGIRLVPLAVRAGATVVATVRGERKAALASELGAHDHITTGRIRLVIGQAVPLHGAADAHAAMAERTVAGKTLLLTGREAS